MTEIISPLDCINLKRQAEDFFFQKVYDKSSSLYEQLIGIEPDVKSHYWWLGLSLLLQEKEEEAQLTWLFALEDEYIQDLVGVLDAEAIAQESNCKYQIAWVIRNHIREIDPSNINNLLQIVLLSIKIETFVVEDIADLGILQILNLESKDSLNCDFLLDILQYLFEFHSDSPSLLDFSSACLTYDIHTFLSPVFTIAYKFANIQNRMGLAIKVAEICLNADPTNIEIYKHTILFYYSNKEFAKSVEAAKYCFSITKKIEDKIAVNYIYLRSLIASQGYSEQILSEVENHKFYLKEIYDQFNQSALSLDRIPTMHLFPTTFLFPYINDAPQASKTTRNQLSSMCQTILQSHAQEQVTKYHQNIKYCHKPLKIGYVSECLHRHSIGWLARWLFKYHNREDFLIHAYFVTDPTSHSDSNQQWIAQNSDIAVKCGLDGFQIAEMIYHDNIDILVDLDSITSDVTCEAISLKPAPVQVTWLGWDSSGIPAIDYYIADPYVLPEDAQDYYSEKIWRLPQTYIAVDGFEVAVPSLTRAQLGISDDAVIYLSTQTIFKLHPEIIRNQIEIIKSVSNSYLLIKGTNDQDAIQSLVTKIAEEEGICGDRLRFLAPANSEAEHRANLGIADVVLDTYPYNGATTTMETLWMCIPLVTRVGQQFAARNSYTMMINAGVTEGIAWTDREYVEWGIRFGNDENLRKQVFWKLKQSRKTSPLWNAQQFTRNMEDAYQQMWNIYLEGKNK